MAGVPYDGGGIGVSVAATRAASDDELRALLRARRRRDARARHDDRRGQGRLRADRRRRGARAAAGARGHRRDDLPRRPRRAARGARRPRRLPRPRVRADARRLRAARPLGRRLLRAGLAARLHRATRRAACSPPAGMPGSACACTATSSSAGPGVRLAVELGAASVDHCTFLTGDDVDALVGAAGTTVATLLPGVEFSTRSPYPDARHLLDAGVDVALATDCNPGTCNTASMPFVVALAVREMRMTAAEALVAATVGGARALRRSDVGPGGRGVARRPRRARRAVVRAPGLPARDAARPRPRARLTARITRPRHPSGGPPPGGRLTEIVVLQRYWRSAPSGA